MQKKTVVRAFILMLIVIGFISGCSVLNQLIQKPTLTYKGMAVKEMTLFDGTFLLNFTVSNPNPIGVPVDQMTYDVKIDGRDFIKGSVDKKTSLPGNGSADVAVPIHLNYMDFFKSILDFTQKSELAYEVSGTVLVYGFNIPYHAKGTLPVPKPPTVTLNHVEIKSMSFMNASIVFVVDMVNSNPFPILMDSLDYQIKLAGLDLAGGSAKAVQPINASGKSTISLPVTVSVLKMGQAILDILGKTSSEYDISGSMQFNVPKVGSKKFAFSKKGNVPLGKN
jgi:LEA14-like dessication related protein